MHSVMLLEGLYTEVFSTGCFYRSFFLLEAFFSLLDHQYDILTVLIKSVFCPPRPIKWPVF